MVAKQNKEYGYDVQKVYLEMMLSDAQSFVRCQTIFDHTLFDRKLQDAAEFINKYVTEHNTLPTEEMVNATCKTQLKVPEGLREEHYDWLLNEFETFTRHKGLERAILESANLLEEGNYGPVEDKIKSAVQVGLQKDLGIDYFRDPKGRLMGLKDSNGQVSTGWASLDRKLFGGFNRGELNIFAGGSGAGKSLFLANLGVNWALAGMNVVYLTFELSEALVAMRVDSMTTDIPTKEIFKDLDTVEMKVKLVGKKSGAFQIKYMPSGKNTNDIRSFVKEYEIKTGKRIDVLLIDYLDLMMPMSRKVSPSDLFVKDKFVSEELRNLAMETQTVFVTASQLNRASVEEIEFDHSHIAGGLSKIQTADNVIGIFTSRAMKERGRYQIQLMKTRSSSGVGSKIDLEFDIDSLRIRDLADDEEYQEFAKRKSTVFDQIKRTSTPGEIKQDESPADPTEGKTVGKIRAETDSTKLREFLGNLGSE
jgi:archaellum biogenesis ATPase FlaH|tara:strand:+ start:1689 stop:3122 length:1434 start_codon:yes stop_codon:yes gene_type:complete